MGAAASVVLGLASAWNERSSNLVIVLTLLTGFGLYVYQSFVAASEQNLTAIAARDSGVAVDMATACLPAASVDIRSIAAPFLVHGGACRNGGADFPLKLALAH
jgi:hypothetical protein